MCSGKTVTHVLRCTVLQVDRLFFVKDRLAALTQIFRKFSAHRKGRT